MNTKNTKNTQKKIMTNNKNWILVLIATVLFASAPRAGEVRETTAEELQSKVNKLNKALADAKSVNKPLATAIEAADIELAAATGAMEACRTPEECAEARQAKNNAGAKALEVRADALDATNKSARRILRLALDLADAAGPGTSDTDKGKGPNKPVDSPAVKEQLAAAGWAPSKGAMVKKLESFADRLRERVLGSSMSINGRRATMADSALAKASAAAELLSTSQRVAGELRQAATLMKIGEIDGDLGDVEPGLIDTVISDDDLLEMLGTDDSSTASEQ